jgi:CheY-like chemotaxis protein
LDEPTILVTDDSPEDLELTVRALRRAGYGGALASFHDAPATLRHLDDAVAPAIPCLALVDLNLPGMDGRALIEQIRARPRLRAMPVVVVSTSSDPREIERCLELGATAYLRKQLRLRRFEAAVAGLAPMWEDAARRRDLPTHGEP